MSWLTRSRPAAPRIEPTFTAVPERRSTVDYGPGWAGLAAVSGGGTSPRAAENLATVTACINAIASGLAALPATVYRADGAGRVEAPTHPVARLLRAPNSRQTWPDICEWLFSQALLWGNALAAIEHDGAGRPVGLTPIPWAGVAVQVLPSGRLAYDVVLTTAPYGGPAVSRRYLEGEVLHLKDRSDDSIVGRSRLSRAPAVIASAEGLTEFSQAVWRNAATPSMAVSLPSNASAEAIKRIRAQWDAVYSGAVNAKRVAYVENGMTVTPLSISPEDAEVLDSRKFSVIELCRLFNVPPPIVQDYSFSTFTNAAQASTWFATNTLAPWARRLEAEFSRSLFSDPVYHLEIDLSGLVRGDYATRWTANVAAVQAGILTPDEIRQQEGYGPLPSPATA